jgi:hypothetical protein
VAATEVEEDVDGRPTRGALPTASTTEDEEHVDGRPPGGATGGSGSGHHQG